MSFIINPYRYAAASSNGLLTGLESYWKFEESSGTVYDAHGSNDGTVTGATYSATGKSGNCLSYDGSGDFVDVGNITTPSAFSWSIWYNGTSKAGYNTLVCKGNVHGSGSGESYRSRIDQTTGYLDSVVWWGSGFNYDIITGSTDLADGSWHNIVITFDGDVHTVYTDGSQTGQTTGLGGSTQSPTENVYFGKTGHPSAFYYMNGRMDECGFWSRVIDSSDVSTIWNSGSGLFYDNFTS